MDITLSTTSTKPGQAVKIDFKTTPNSSVYVLGVDQSVTLLGDGNDLTKERLEDDLSGFNAHLYYPELVIDGSNGLSNRYLDIGKSNAFILTNALDGKFDCEKKILARSTYVINDLNHDDSSTANLDYDAEKSDEATSQKIRKDFRETWIFDTFEADGEGRISMPIKVPDTITSFIVSGFAVHPENGLGLAEIRKVTVFQDFFVKLYLPYSIRLGETLKVDVNVFNYISGVRSTAEIEVEMHNNGNEFEFVDVINCMSVPLTGRTKIRYLTIKPQSEAATYFYIKAKKTGKINIYIQARTTNLKPNREDVLEKQLLVENEGRTVYINNPMLFDLTNNEFMSHDFKIPNLENAIKRSITIEVSAIGDLLGPARKHIQNLV